jgi:hypothetical protein
MAEGTGDGMLLLRPIFDGCESGVWSSRASIEIQNGEIKNSTVDPFSLHLAKIKLTGSLIGTGNTGWGLNASGSNNDVEISGFYPTITGSAGAVTVDGVNDETWANFIVVGDYAMDENTGARVNYAQAY